MTKSHRIASAFAGTIAVLLMSDSLVASAVAGNHAGTGERTPMPGAGPMMGPGLVMPGMDAARGRKLFASKGCVLCHSVNGVGGQDARALDASTMDLPMNPFEFTARMWAGAEPMIMLQREELGGQIEFTGQELADIIAFIHDADEQKKFSVSDIPHEIGDVMTKPHGKREKH